MRTLTHMRRIHIRRLYWIIKPDATDALHIYPNRDLMRHETTNCWCGPKDLLEHDRDGADVWLVEHHSLDAREGRER